MGNPAPVEADVIALTRAAFLGMVGTMKTNGAPETMNENGVQEECPAFFARIKQFLTAWVRGVGIYALLFCLSLVTGVLAYAVDFFPAMVSVPLLIVFGPVVIYWTALWLAPDLFGDGRAWWRRKNETKQ